jgi:xeroderma pigmentosum group C-complementing protein
MARAKGSSLHKPSGTEPTTTPRRSARGKASQEDAGVPDVFHDLLSEATSSKAAGPDEDRKPIKKRKAAASAQLPSSSPPREAKRLRAPMPPALASEPQPPPRNNITSAIDGEGEDRHAHLRRRQTIEDSDESDGSDVEWEDALGDGHDTDDDEEMVEPEVGDISITIGGGKGGVEESKRQVRRRGITSVDKKRRLEIHKMHLLCLLYHVHRRNAWCNDAKVQAILRKLPPPKILDSLVPNPDFTQYQASKRFVDGIQELKKLWSNRFSLTAFGMHRPRWADADADVRPFSDFDELDNPMEKQDFRRAASALQGSQDIGSQLFCALLRAIGIDARLVCSLQCLPFVSSAQPSTPQKPFSSKNVIVVDPYNREETSPSNPKTTRNPSRPKKLSRMERLLGERSAALNTPVHRPKKKYHNAYPVYWVEVFNPAAQKWIPADPLSTATVNAPEKLEPPLSNPSNSLVYAIAFEDDLTAKDVTRRYTKAYNAKTRKFRVDSTPNGLQWLRRALKIFARATPLDRDQVEDGALARKEGAEGIPKNVQDFKDHPIYVLERHLKYNEIIYPMQALGKVNVSSAMNPKMEPIYRRSNVHLVRSADKWYRMGRDVKDGEQPLKHAKPKKNTRRSIGPDEMFDGENLQDEVGAALYAEFQTDLYIPPPVVRGKVPRNAFGNLDLYVPSMVPPGGVHIRHKLAGKAARLIGVDSADAVTGFSFKGRHGTAVVQGVVVAAEYAEAVEAVVDGFEFSAEAAENEARRSEALRMWRRFFLGLRIAQRVNAIEIDGETGPKIDVQAEMEKEDKAIAEDAFAGGFFPDEGDDGKRVAPISRPHVTVAHQENYNGGFTVDENSGGGGFVQEDDDIGSTFEPESAGGFISGPPALVRFGSSILEEHQVQIRRNHDYDDGNTTEEEEEDGEEESGGFLRESPLAPDLTLGNADVEMPDISTHTDISTDLGKGSVADGRSTEVATNNTTLENRHTTEPAQNQGAIQLGASGRSEKLNGKAAVAEMETVDPSPPSTLRSEVSEVGSLLLEDPEDEDADPDWLVDVT